MHALPRVILACWWWAGYRSFLQHIRTGQKLSSGYLFRLYNKSIKRNEELYPKGDFIMGFKEAVRTCLREKYFTFRGRASRSEYWYFYLFILLVTVVYFLIIAALFGFNPPPIVVGASRDIEFSTIQYVAFAVGGILAIYLYIPILVAQVRRFHDRNLSGWWILAGIIVGFIPFVGIIASIAIFVITVLKGTDGDNKYGPDPLKIQNSADVFA